MLVGLCGTLLLLVPVGGLTGLDMTHGKFALAVIALQLGNIAWCWGSIVQKRSTVTVHPVMSGAVQQIFVGLFFLIPSLFLEGHDAKWDLKGAGAIVYMSGHEGRGIGLWAKAVTYVLQDGGEDTYQANRSLGLPDDMVLDPALRDSVATLVRTHLATVRSLTPAWIAEERATAKNPTLRGVGLADALFLRTINEMAIVSVETAGPAHDAAWLKAALAPNACRSLYAQPYAQRIALIQASRPASTD